MEAVSVIIPTYNRARYLPRAIQSVLAAIEEGDEIIVVDDGSTDDTATVVAPWLDRIRYVKIANSGAAGARNHGIRLATKPLLTFLDSDDEWFADKLALQRPFMAARPDVLFCFSDFAFQDEESGNIERMYLKNWHRVERSWTELLGPSIQFSSTAPLPPGREDFAVHIGDLYPALIEGPFVAAWTSMIRREAAGHILRFKEGIPICEDWWGYAELARRGQAAFFVCETAWNHGHSGERVSSTGTCDFLTCRLAMTEQVWGRDETFRHTHAALYSDTVASIYRARARWYLGRGRLSDARRDLRMVPSVSVAERLFAALPRPLALLLGALRRSTMGVLNSSLVVLPLVLSNLQLEMADAAPALIA